jgi:hypothetical protein
LFAFNRIIERSKSLVVVVALHIGPYAGIAFVAPNGFALVGEPFPTAQHWLKLPTRPVDFDANSIWAYFQKLKEIESGKPFNLCVFCLKTFGSYNATKCNNTHPDFTVAK